MYAIETELGRFEADTERDAKKQLRNARARARKEEASRQALNDIARSRAERQAYRIYSVYHDRANCYPAWRLYRSGYGYKVARMIAGELGYAYTLSVDTPDGEARNEYWRMRLTAVVIDGSGYAIAVEMTDETSGAHLYAIGTHAGIIQLAEIPGIPQDWFRTGDEE